MGYCMARTPVRGPLHGPHVCLRLPESLMEPGLDKKSRFSALGIVGSTTESKSLSHREPFLC